jgi:hypothetical protein
MWYKRLFNSFNVMLSIILSLGFAQEKIQAECPCDIYASGGTPCAAAHSTTRSLYGDYTGPLYQIRRVSDNKTMNIYPETPGGVANTIPQDTFLKGTSGRISIIYDQSPNHNDLTKGNGHWGPVDTEAVATEGQIKLNGHRVFGIYTHDGWSPAPGVGYRNNATKGMPTGNASEGLYMVCDAKRYNQWCCFDYGNAQTNGEASGAAVMECIYYGSSTQFNKCGGNGPWVCNDMEFGMTCGAHLSDTSNHSIDVANINYLTAYIKGGAHPGRPDTNFHCIKAGDAQKGKLEIHYAGPRDAKAGYYPLKLQGAIILGTGGDNSHSGIGTFFEGCIVKGCPYDSIDDKVQENIKAAGYGRETEIVSVKPFKANVNKSSIFSLDYNPSNSNVIVSYNLQAPRQVKMSFINQQGRRVATIDAGVVPAGKHMTTWNAKHIPAGVYVCWASIEGMARCAGRITIGK